MLNTTESKMWNRCLICAHRDTETCLANEKTVRIIDGELECDAFLPKTITVTDGTALRTFPRGTDNVNHPAHYETGRFECFDVMIETQGKEAVLNFCICNAFKYIYRFRNKGGDEDIKKANWYLSKYLELRDSE